MEIKNNGLKDISRNAGEEERLSSLAKKMSMSKLRRRKMHKNSRNYTTWESENHEAFAVSVWKTLVQPSVFMKEEIE